MSVLGKDMKHLIRVIFLGLALVLPSIASAQVSAGQPPNPSYVGVPNAGSTGTTLFTLTKYTGAPSTAVIAATSDTDGVQGITVNGSGTTGTALIQKNGISYCVFDNATTAGDYVGISSGTAGNCHDTGFAFPANPPTGQVVGTVLTTNGSAGTYIIDLKLGALSRTIYEAVGGAGQTSATTTYFSPFGPTTNNTTESATTQAIVPVNGTVSDLQCRMSATNGGGNSDAFTVTSGTFGATGLTGSSITCTATNGTNCSDTTHTLAVTAGQAVEIKDVTTGTPAARTLACSFILEF